MDQFHPSIVPSQVCKIETESSPLTILEKIEFDQHSTETFAHNYTDEERATIEEITCDQSDSVYWLKYRKGLITVSNFQRVVSHMGVLEKSGKPSVATSNLVDTVINGAKFKGNESTKYGKREEPKALRAYEVKASTGHTNVVVSRCGLFISKEFNIGASPDGILKCDCHGTRLIEIKCPITLSCKNIASMNFLHMYDNQRYALKKSGNTYYAQIQGQMGVTGIHEADLVVWDGKKVLVVPEPFDQEYWLVLSDKLSKFFQDNIMPAVRQTKTSKPVLQERTDVQNKVSRTTGRYSCGKCGENCRRM